MLETFSRTQPVESRVEICTFKTVNPAAFPDPGLYTHDRAFIWPGYNQSEEVLETDNTSPNSVWKDCQHYRVSSQSSSAMGSSKIISSLLYGGDPNSLCEGLTSDPYAFYEGVYGPAGKCNNALPALYAVQPDGKFIPPPAKLDELNNRALSVMLPLIRSDLSLINSIYELKDFVSLKHHVRGSVQEVRKASVWLLNAMRGSGSLSRPLSALVRLVAGNYLQYKFNFAPLVSDIRAIYKALKTCERRINDLIARTGRPQSKHFAFVWNELGDVEPQDLTVSAWDHYPNVPVTLKFSRVVVNVPTTFHAQIQYNFNYTAYQVEHARLLGLLDILGVNLNPRIIWNAIPWSFVVDWVLGVNRFLDQFAIANMKPQINIHRYLWSVKRERRIYVSRRSSWTDLLNPSIDTTVVPLPVITETAYRRSVGVPQASSIISSGINSQEFTLGSALILSRRRKVRHR